MLALAAHYTLNWLGCNLLLTSNEILPTMQAEMDGFAAAVHGHCTLQGCLHL